MPATIGNILKTKPELVTTTPDILLYAAIDKMMQYDYSQLPVLDPADRPIGMLTSDSIVRALHHFGVGVREPKDAKEQARHLRVRDAMDRRVATCSPEDEVFNVHRQLRDVSSVLVLDDRNQLIGIITGYDTTEYLRQRVQDIVFVQDIEERIKDYIRLAFRQPDGIEDRVALQAAIGVRRVTGGLSAQTFKRLLEAYLKRKESLDAQIDEQIADQVLLAGLPSPKEEPQDFDHLSLGTYIDLFLKHGLQRYGQIFQLDRATIFQMLNSVRQTRNNLSHLKIDISARARDELRHCRTWLEDYYDDARAAVLPPQAVELSAQDSSSVPTLPTIDADVSASHVTVDEQTMPAEGRYGKLADWLFSLADDQNHIQLSFGQIEQLIGGKLPISARENRSWWINDSTRGPQSDQWLKAGWRTNEVDLQHGLVTFMRLQERERAYRSFFEMLMTELARSATFPLYQSSQVGYYWQSITRLPTSSPSAGYLTFAFTRAQHPRADFYIDTGDQVRNKRIFDALYASHDAIESSFGETLTWERLDDKRASRVACYYDKAVTIHSSPENLETLRTWAVDVLIRLHKALDQPSREVLDALDVEQSSSADSVAA